MNFAELARSIALASLCLAPAFALGQSRSDSPTSLAEWQKAAGGTMEFEAASICQDKSGIFKVPSIALSPDDGWQPTDGLFHADFPLSVYIEFAYKLLLAPEQRQTMLASLPKWVSTDIFEIHARAAGKPTKDQLRLMMQSLLAERFGLKVHFESQETPVLALTLIKAGKLGPHLSAHADICEASKAAGNGSAKDDIFPPPCLDGSFFMVPRPNHVRRMGTRNVTTALIAASLPTLGDLGRPVVDQTGLRGTYDFWLEWRPESNQAASPAAGNQPLEEGPTLLEALRDQLGLKLERTTAPLDVLVIDHIDRPSEN